MKNSIRTIFAAFVFILALASCQQETNDFNDRLTDLEDRVSKLEKLCAEMNTNISSLQGIVSALQNQDYITAVNELTSDGKVVGYTINFAKGQPITIYHGKDGVNGKDGADGKDGKDGANGQNGQDGKDGQDGADGHTPVIGVKQDTDGVWYWTIDGEWLLDGNGQKVKAVGTDGKDGVNGQDGANGQNGQDGKDGQNGQDGKDGITPQLKIEEGYWYVSTDNGQTWTQLGKATGENGKDGVDGKDGKDGIDGKDGDSFFQSVSVTDTEVTFVTSDGQTFVVKRASALSIEFDSADLVVMSTNATRNIHYTITSGVDDITIEALSSADIKVKVNKTDAKTGTLQVKTGDTIDEYSKVVVLVSNGTQTIMRTLSFEAEAIVVTSGYSITFPAEGGSKDVTLFSNVGFQIVIPKDCQWLSCIQTKGFTEHSLVITADSNDTYESRQAFVRLVDKETGNTVSATIEVMQKSIGAAQESNGSILVLKTGGKAKIVKSSNSDQIVIPSDIDWIKGNTVSAENFILNVFENSQTDSRYADVVVSSQYGDRVVRIFQFGDRYRLTIEHTGSSYMIPEVDWGNNTSYYSLIGWGDGYSDIYTSGLSYDYNDSKSSRQVVLNSDIIPETVVFQDVKGISHIDLTNFQSIQ